MRECDNSKIHISNNSLLSICLLIMLDTLLLVPSLHCNTLLHLTTLHQTTLQYTFYGRKGRKVIVFDRDTLAPRRHNLVNSQSQQSGTTRRLRAQGKLLTGVSTDL